MRIALTTSGSLGGFGPRREGEVETTNRPDLDARLRTLMKGLPAQEGSGSSAAVRHPDAQSVVLDVDDAGTHRRFVIDESIADSDVLDLIDDLRSNLHAD